MKEYKFRAWDKRNKKWFHQDLIIMTNAAFYEDYRAFEDGNSLFDYEYELMQDTGLRDKNGTIIFEGDILTFEDAHYSSSENGQEFETFQNVGSIEWDKEQAQYFITNRQSVDLETFFEYINETEIIGNIYERAIAKEAGK